MNPIRLDDIPRTDRLNAKVQMFLSRQTTGMEDLCQAILHLAPGVEMVKHNHERSVEVFFPLEGKAELVVGDQVLTMEPGMVAFAPRGVDHFFRNPFDALFRAHCTYVPHI